MGNLTPQQKATKKYKEKYIRIEFGLTPKEMEKINLPDNYRAKAKEMFIKKYLKK